MLSLFGFDTSDGSAWCRNIKLGPSFTSGRHASTIDMMSPPIAGNKVTGTLLRWSYNWNMNFLLWYIIFDEINPEINESDNNVAISTCFLRNNWKEFDLSSGIATSLAKAVREVGDALDRLLEKRLRMAPMAPCKEEFTEGSL